MNVSSRRTTSTGRTTSGERRRTTSTGRTTPSTNIIPSENYSEELQTFLSQLLPEFLNYNEVEADPNLVDYWSEENLSLWRTAFTDKSFDPTDNYELLEMFGDRISKAAFAYFILTQDFPSSESILTELQNYYLAETMQIKKAKELGFEKFIRYRLDYLPEKKLEDVFESFAGALFYVSDSVNVGLGFYNVTKFLSWLYREEDLVSKAEELKYGAPKTVVQQNLSKLRINRSLKSNYTDTNGYYTYTLSLDQTGLSFLRKRGIQIDRIIGEGTGISKNAAQANAYQNALEKLNQAGVTREWAEEVHTELILSDQRFQEVRPKLESKMKRDRFERITFQVNRDDESYAEVSLIGIRQNGQRELITTASGRYLKEAQNQAIKNYVI